MNVAPLRSALLTMFDVANYRDPRIVRYQRLVANMNAYMSEFLDGNIKKIQMKYVKDVFD